MEETNQQRTTGEEASGPSNEKRGEQTEEAEEGDCKTGWGHQVRKGSERHQTERVAAQRSAQNTNPAFRHRCSVVTKQKMGIRVSLTGDCKQGIVTWVDETATIPNLSLTTVDPDATASPTCRTTRKCALAVTRRRCCRGKQGGVRPPRGGTGLNEGLCVGPVQRAKAQEITFLASFALPNFVGLPRIVFPQVRRRIAVELEDERKHRVASWELIKPRESARRWCED